MKLYSKLFACTLAVGMFSCASDEPGGPTPTGPDNGNGIYSNIRLTMPRSSGTRSDETPEGTEMGQDYENNVGSVLVILAEKKADGKNFTYLTAAIRDDVNQDLGKNNNYKIVFNEKQPLFDNAGQEVYAFAICNPTEEIRQKILGKYNPADGSYSGGLGDGITEDDSGNITGYPDLDLDEICSTDIADTWTRMGFLMTSVEMVSTKLPSKEKMEAATEPTGAVDLITDDDGNAKAIPVVRTMSRIDFKDKAPDTSKPLTYTIYDDPVKKTTTFGEVVLTNMALMNMRDQFFYFPRVTSNGTDFTLCPGVDGLEFALPDGYATIESGWPEDYSQVYVASPTGRTFSSKLEDGFVFNPTSRNEKGYESGSGLIWYPVSDIINGTVDNDDNWEWNDNMGTSLKDGWHIWTYATENTFADYGKTDFTYDPKEMTAVVFEAEIKPSKELNVVAGEPMYAYDGMLYGNANEIAKKLENYPISTLKTAFESAFANKAGEGETPDWKIKDGVKAKDFGFIEYKPYKVSENEWKYYCYYFYYNVHQDDNKASSVGPMEYAMVRNNVYKIAVSNVLRAGGFEVEDPTKWDVYFQVEVELKPWVVRVKDDIILK